MKSWLPKLPPTLKILLEKEGVPFLTLFSPPPPPPSTLHAGLQLFFFVHSSFFSESQINSIFDVRRLPARSLRNSCLAGSVDRKARPPVDNELSSHCPYLGLLEDS